MSTDFVLRRADKPITDSLLIKWSKSKDIQIHSIDGNEVINHKSPKNRLSKAKSICIKFGNDYIWLWKSKKKWHEFTRFGMNSIDGFIDFVEAATSGYVLSEHEDEFYDQD